MAEARILDDPFVFRPPDGAPTSWVEHVRSDHLSVGTYCLRAGGVDDQVPHREDELYVVASGQATLEVAGERIPVRQGSAVFVPAHARHRFLDIAADLTVLVVFGPAYTGR